MNPTRRSRPASWAPALLMALLLAPAPAAAQFGAVEALARRVSDLSFFYSRGGATGSTALDNDPVGLTSFGVELLFEVAATPTEEAQRRRADRQPTTRRVLREVEVRHGSDGVTDTIYHYDVVTSTGGGYGPDDMLWTMEVGIGYGQVQGLELADRALDLNAMIRTLPSVTLYMNYEPLGAYFGLRTGFLRTYALQVIDGAGVVYPGKAEAFMMGGLLGWAVSIDPSYLFIEAGYTARTFPSVEWSVQGPLPAAIPRALDVSGWGVSMGIQFPVK